jgi:hypothetical protein
MARFAARAEGVPDPTYQWYSVDRNDNATELPGETRPELVMSNPPMGISRYLVTASNDRGTVQSGVAVLQVQTKLKAMPRVSVDDSVPMLKKGAIPTRTAEQIAADRVRVRVDREAEIADRKGRRNRILLPVLLVGLVMLGAIALMIFGPKAPKITSPLTIRTNEDASILLSVTAAGTEPMVYEWFRDGQMISEGSISVCTPKDWNLTNSGSFSVTVINKSGAVTSGPVNWPGKPKIVILNPMRMATNAPNRTNSPEESPKSRPPLFEPSLARTNKQSGVTNSSPTNSQSPKK